MYVKCFKQCLAEGKHSVFPISVLNVFMGASDFLAGYK